MTPPRKQRIWDVATFARHAYGDESPAAHVRARRALKKLDAKHGGALLVSSEGRNRCYTFYPATLFALEPDLFAPVENLEARIDAAEDAVDEMRDNERAIVGQVRTNSRAIAKLRSARC
jgi:hypothetical protein